MSVDAHDLLEAGRRILAVSGSAPVLAQLGLEALAPSGAHAALCGAVAPGEQWRDATVSRAAGRAARPATTIERSAALAAFRRVSASRRVLSRRRSDADDALFARFEPVGEEPVHGILAVPLVRRGGRVGGVVVLVSHVPDGLVEADVPALVGLARCGATALENAEARAAAERHRERLLLFAEATEEALWDWTLATDHLWWGPGIHKLLGGVGLEVRPDAAWWRARIHPADLEHVLASLAEARASTRSSWRAEYRFARADGSWAVVEDRASFLRDERGTAYRLVGSLRDVTAARRLEDEMIRASRLESLGLLAGGIAHDFNNLLAGILANVSLVQRRLEGEPALEARLAAASAASMRASGLTRQLLTFAKRGAPVRGALDLRVLLPDAAPFALQGTVSTLDLAIADDLRLVWADADQIGQVVQNLVLNASQAMPDGGVVRVEAANASLPDGSGAPLPPGDYVRVAVSDEGPGIPEAVRHRIFDPFFTTKTTGSGIGLATVYAILRRHDGWITAEGGAVGARFAFYVPVVRTSSPEAASPSMDASPRESAPSSPASASAPGVSPAARVLFMDDDVLLRSAATTVLEEAGLEVVPVAEGGAAVARYAEAFAAGRPFALVVLDLTVRGGLGGREALRRLMALDPNVRAVLSSGYAEELDGAVEGFVGVLRKPYRVEDLLAAVAAELDLPRG